MKKTIEFSDALCGELKYIHNKDLDRDLAEHLMDAAHEFYINAKTKEYENKLEKLNDRRIRLTAELAELNKIRDRQIVEDSYLEGVPNYADYHTEGLIKD